MGDVLGVLLSKSDDGDFLELGFGMFWWVIVYVVEIHVSFILKFGPRL